MSIREQFVKEFTVLVGILGVCMAGAMFCDGMARRARAKSATATEAAAWSATAADKADSVAFAAGGTWTLHLGPNQQQVLSPIANPDATEAWGAIPFWNRVYGGRPGDGSIEQDRRIRDTAYVLGLSRERDEYVVCWADQSTGEYRGIWTCPAADWNQNGPNVLTNPVLDPVTVTK